MPVRYPAGVAYLAQRAGVPTFMAAAWRGPRGRRVIEVSDPGPPPARDDPAGADALMRTIGAWFERPILERPEQWGGWLVPVLARARTGAAPTASPDAVDRTR